MFTSTMSVILQTAETNFKQYLSAIRIFICDGTASTMSSNISKVTNIRESKQIKRTLLGKVVKRGHFGAGQGQFPFASDEVQIKTILLLL
jgi:hypothetical protein